MLAVESPLASRAHVHELRDDHLLPVVRGLKSRPLLPENPRVPIDAVADSDLCSDRGRHPLRTVCRQQLVDLCLLNLGQSHSCPPVGTVSVWRTLTITCGGCATRSRRQVDRDVMPECYQGGEIQAGVNPGSRHSCHTCPVATLTSWGTAKPYPSTYARVASFMVATNAVRASSLTAATNSATGMADRCLRKNSSGGGKRSINRT